MIKYEKISDEMRDRIKNGIYPVHTPIPDEVTLAKQFDCSRMTMRRALDILVMEGLLYRKRGHGTFILQNAIQNNRVNVVSQETLGLTALLKDKKITSKIIKYEVQFPTAEIASQLAIDINSPVYHVIRLRLVEGEPYVTEETYMPVQLIPGINEDVLRKSIYGYMKTALGLGVGGSHRKIRATKARELDYQYLECKEGDPVLEVEQLGFLNTGIPFEYSFSRHRYDRFEFTAVNIRRK